MYCTAKSSYMRSKEIFQLIIMQTPNYGVLVHFLNKPAWSWNNTCCVFLFCFFENKYSDNKNTNLDNLRVDFFTNLWVDGKKSR